MPYKFPERYPRANDSIDITEINRHFRDIAENLSGNIGEHNLQEAAYSAVPSSLYTIDQTQTAVLMGFGAPAGSPAKHARPQEITSEYNSGTILLSNTGTWEVIEQVNIGASDSFRVLHIFAQTNYSWTGYTSGTNTSSNITFSGGTPVSGRHEFSNSESWGDPASPSAGTKDYYQPYESPNFHLAIRVAGTKQCVSGQRNETYKPHMPLKSLEENQPLESTAAYSDTKWPGFLDYRQQAVSGPAHTTMTVDLVDIVNIPPGPATYVQLIAKRTQSLKNKKYNVEDVIAFLTRKLFVVQYDTSKPKSRSISPIGIAPIRKGDAATTASLNTQKLQKLKTKINTLQLPDFNRINRYHIGPVLAQSTGVGSPLVANEESVSYSSPITIQNRCPGEHNGTFVTPIGTLTGNTGWTPLTTTSGGSTEFLLYPSSVGVGGDCPTSTQRGYILLTGHIHLQHITKNGLAVTDSDHNLEFYMGCVGLYYKIGSTRYLINNSVIPVSKVTVPSPPQARLSQAIVLNSNNIHVPLMSVISVQSLLADDIDSFGICVSTINWEDDAAVDVEVLNASLCVEYYKTN